MKGQKREAFNSIVSGAPKSSTVEQGGSPPGSSSIRESWGITTDENEAESLDDSDEKSVTEKDAKPEEPSFADAVGKAIKKIAVGEPAEVWQKAKPEDKGAVDLKEKKKEKVEEEEEEPEPESETKDGQKEEEIIDEEIQRLLDTKDSDIRTKDGRPMGEQGSLVIKRLKKTVRKFAEEIKTLKSGVANPDPALKEELEQIRTAHKDLRKKYEDRYFEETPEWEDEFVKPLSEVNNEAGKWIASHDHEKDSEEYDAIETHRVGLSKSLRAGDEVAFYEHGDEIAELLKKGAAARFRATLPDLWKTFWIKENAFKNKDSARKQIIEKSATFNTDRIKEAQAGIDELYKSFENANQKIIHAYKTQPQFKALIDYEGTVEAPLNDAKQLIDFAIRHRTFPPDLQRLILQGVTANMRDKELDILRTALKEEKDAVSRLEAKLGNKDKTIKRMKPSHAASSSKDDDDDDSDEPKSFTEAVSRRLKEMGIGAR